MSRRSDIVRSEGLPGGVAAPRTTDWMLCNSLASGEVYDGAVVVEGSIPLTVAASYRRVFVSATVWRVTTGGAV